MKLSQNLCPGAGREVATVTKPHLLTCPVCDRPSLTVAGTRKNERGYVSTVIGHRAKLAEPGDIGDPRHAAADVGVDWERRSA